MVKGYLAPIDVKEIQKFILKMINDRKKVERHKKRLSYSRAINQRVFGIHT